MWYLSLVSQPDCISIHAVEGSIGFFFSKFNDGDAKEGKNTAWYKHEVNREDAQQTKTTCKLKKGAA